MPHKTKRTNNKPITAAQIKRIHTIKSILHISDENYRAALEYRFTVTTSKDLTMDQAQTFIRDLEELALKAQDDRRQAEHRRKIEEIRQKYPDRHSDLDNRPGMATGAQLRKIEAMWQDISIIPDHAARGRALRLFVQRIAGVASLRFLDQEGASKVINALEAMQKQAAHGKTSSRQGAGQ